MESQKIEKLMGYSSTCRCGKTSVQLVLPNPIESYAPRECDCDFCQSNQITYLSDPEGSLFVASHEALNQSKQGSEQATFWHCSSCEQMVVVTNTLDDEVKGAVNGKLLSNKYTLQQPQAVFPKLLSPTEKRDRWSAAWLRVTFNV